MSGLLGGLGLVSQGKALQLTAHRQPSKLFSAAPYLQGENRKPKQSPHFNTLPVSASTASLLHVVVFYHGNNAEQHQVHLLSQSFKHTQKKTVLV